MATKVQAPQLTPNNRIYLYQLLSRELGCGKQTFMPAVEEALARDRMTSDDLGFESTRALLEALEEFVKLTVFKGGRIYATVMAQPAWDEALAALESGKAKDAGGPSNKPWKRKKADKALKPVRPKRVKRPEPAPEPEPIAKLRQSSHPPSLAQPRRPAPRKQRPLLRTRTQMPRTSPRTLRQPRLLRPSRLSRLPRLSRPPRLSRLSKRPAYTKRHPSRGAMMHAPALREAPSPPPPSLSRSPTTRTAALIARQSSSPIPSRPSPIRRLWSPHAPHRSSPRTRRPSPRRPHPCRPQFSPRIPPTSQPRSTSPANSSPTCANCSPTAQTSSRSSPRTTHAPAPSNSYPARGHA